jgi:hypothetical protein
MAKASIAQRSFNAGELSPQLKGRTDLEKYGNGCDEMVNFLPQIHGPARKRSGTRFVEEVKTSSKVHRLIPFEFSTEQAYILEFGDETLRFYANGGIVLSGETIYEISTPYSSDDLAALDFAQSADVVYIAHPDYPAYKLSRFGPTNWTLTAVNFDWPPFNDENVDPLTLAPSAVTGNITVTASANLFVAADVGSYFKIEEVLASKHDKWEPGKAVVSGNTRWYEGNLYEASSTGTTGGRPPIHTEGTESDGVVNWVFLHDGAGYFEITAFTNATTVSATVVKRLPSTTASKKWSEGAWSDRRGYPGAVTFYEDRLWFAGSKSRPQTLWASTTGDYENHQYGTNDDDALNYTINTQDMNTILWLSPGKVLAVGTANGEFTLSATQISDPVTPTNVRIVPQTTFGSSENVRPLRIGNVIIFLQRSERKMREYVYEFQSDSYVAVNLNVLAEHITGSGVVDMTYQQEPYQIVWSACACGTLIGLTYEREEEVVGWHRHTVGGFVESVASIPHWDGDQDVLFMIVRRTIDGVTKRYVEYMEKYYDNDESFYVDSGLTYTGTPVSSLSGLTHLEGKEVAVLIDGAVHPNVTVDSGGITLQYSGSTISVGLPFTARLRTMPLEAGAADGVAMGKTMRINNIVMRFDRTGPGVFYGPDASRLDELHPRRTTDLMDNPIALFTGNTPALPWPGEYQQSPQLIVEHRLPTACTLVALMPQLHTYDR